MSPSRLVACALLLSPVVLVGQKREDILSIQRDVAQLQDQVKQLQASQDQKMATLQALVQQAVDQSARLSDALAAMQKNVGDRLNEQQTRVVGPVATLGTKVDQMSDDLRSVRENVADLTTRLGNLDNKLADISSAVRTLSTPAVAPPPPPGGAATPNASNVPAGVTADGLWTNANRDYSSGKDELAMNEFSDYVKYFPQTENAPTAQYYIGYIYYKGKQYDDAAKAFDDVLERFSENPKTPDSLYYKAYSLMLGGRKTEAASEFKDFLERYPSHPLAETAQARLRTLGATGTRSTTTSRAKKKQQ